MMTRTTRLTGALGAAAVLAAGSLTAAGSAASAGTAPAPKQAVVATGLISPLSVAVAANGTRYFSQNFTGMLMRQRPGGKPQVVYTSKNHAEVGAVSVHGGVVTFATTGRRTAVLRRLLPDGTPTRVADLGRYEKRQNPDSDVHYGFRSLPQGCAAKLPKQVPADYTGITDSHPYSTTSIGRTTYVADAAGNDILAVGPRGAIRTIAVVPPVPSRITADGAKANGLPACTVGRTYDFESVPTDVEVGPDGGLYVSTLPGGPEDPSLGARAQVVRVDPRTGATRLVADGLLSATGLAVAKNGDIYVAELFGGRIARIKHGTDRVGTFVRLPLPADVEITPRGLAVTKNALPGEGQPPRGALVLFTL